MTVLHLISSGGFYGAESMVLTLLQALQQGECRPVLGVFRNATRPNIDVARRAADAGVATEVIPCGGRFDVSAIRHVRTLLRTLHVDVVHTHGYKADLYGFAAARWSGVPITATCHNWTNDTRAVRLYAAIDRIVLRRFQAVAAVSPAVAEALRCAGVPTERSRVIGNGIDMSRFGSVWSVPAPNRCPVIGMVGRLTPQKGFLDVLHCAPAILERYPSATFLIVGDGPQRSELEKAAAELGIRDSVVFTGSCSDVQRHYASMDIFVLPSFNEGMPMTVLEAMAAGKPVIASAVGAIPELVTDGESGYLITPGDRADLTQALNKLLDNPSAAASMGRRGWTRVCSEYSASAMAGKYMRMYQEVLAEVRRAA